MSADQLSRGSVCRGEWVHLPADVIDQLAAFPGVMIADRIRAALERACAVDLEGARDG